MLDEIKDLDFTHKSGRPRGEGSGHLRRLSETKTTISNKIVDLYHLDGTTFIVRLDNGREGVVKLDTSSEGSLMFRLPWANVPTSLEEITTLLKGEQL